MVQGPWEIVPLAGQDIPRNLWNPDVHYHVYESPPLDHILTHSNPIRILTPYLFKIRFNMNIILPCMLKSHPLVFCLEFSIRFLYLLCMRYVTPISDFRVITNFEARYIDFLCNDFLSLLDPNTQNLPFP
jgi:hypothetical protein